MIIIKKLTKNDIGKKVIYDSHEDGVNPEEAILSYWEDNLIYCAYEYNKRVEFLSCLPKYLTFKE